MSAPEGPSTAVRLTVLVVVVGCLFAALFARLWFLQVINAPKAQAVAADNGVRLIYTQAPRGDILDRNGKVLVGNVNEPVIEVDRQVAAQNPTMVARLAPLLGMTVPQLQKAINNLQYSPYAPIPVQPGATPQQILYVQENQALFPGVQATTMTVRSYSPLGVAAANVVGYVGQINGSELARLKGQGYQPGDQIGLAGVEATYESVLRGSPGVERVQVNSQGQVLTAVSSTPPVQGADLRLTIDGQVQMAAVQALEQGEASARNVTDPVTQRKFAANAGAVVVQNPNDGSIVALATQPDYPVQDFVNGISQKEYDSFQNPASNYPLIDRAISGEYNPGSTFKLVTATAGLGTGLITPYSVYDDQGGIRVGPQFFSNDNHSSYGPVSLAKAITVSSDAFFYKIGADLWDGRSKYGPNALQDVADEYGFATSSGIALPGELSGYVLTPAQKAKLHQEYPKDYPYGSWYTGDNVQSAVGEDDVVVTPIQEAGAYSAFANGGTLWQPRLAIDSETQTGKVIQTYPAKMVRRIIVAPDGRAQMLAGFIGVANSQDGTAYGSFGADQFPVEVAGKTGTAQVSTGNPLLPSYKQNTSVFASFAPATAPQYTVVCFVEQAGYGADVAAPIVKQVYENLFHLPVKSAQANNAGKD